MTKAVAWTTEEDERLIRLLHTCTVPKICGMLGRSDASVRKRMAKLGMRVIVRCKCSNWASLAQRRAGMAEAKGIKAETVEEYLARGGRVRRFEQQATGDPEQIALRNGRSYKYKKGVVRDMDKIMGEEDERRAQNGLETILAA